MSLDAPGQAPAATQSRARRHGEGGALNHTLGSECRLAPITPPAPPAHLQGIPPIGAHFFYISVVPIDDPLGKSATAAVGPSDGKATKAPLRPFSCADSNALERAWLGLSSDEYGKNHSLAQRDRSPSPSLSRANTARLEAIVKILVAKHAEKHRREGWPTAPAEDAPAGVPASSTPVCCPELLIDAPAELRKVFCAVTRRRQRALDQERVITAVMRQLQRRSGASIRTGDGAETPKGRQQPSPTLQASQGSTADNFVATSLPNASASIAPRPPVVDGGLSGRPFVRVETEIASSPSAAEQDSSVRDGRTPVEAIPESELEEERRLEPETESRQPRQGATDGARVAIPDSVEVPVGVSRLHMVSLPVLQMKPIYWSPVNDIAVVMRATWFYRDSMEPVEAAVANQLEAGYRELRPWTETWADEIRSALDVGPLGEEKVAHRLWPNYSWLERQSKTSTAGSRDYATPTEPPISADPFCAARCFRGEAAAEGTMEAVHPSNNAQPDGYDADEKKVGMGGTDDGKSYANYHVLYKDAMTAFLLKPSLKPSAYYGRRPLVKLMKGATVGIPVVRGFDYGAWEIIHDKTKRAAAAATGKSAHETTARMAASATSPSSFSPPYPPYPASSDSSHTAAGTGLESSSIVTKCQACEAEDERGQVVDLVLVAHGIGQKFAERVESFHFTHAINGFRRALNLEMMSDAVQSVLRPGGQNGIMVLPVNWRHKLSFEAGGPAPAVPVPGHVPTDGFGLKDIEPQTIPAVRSIISDVMFDIPFYMSHHKQQMIAALVGEANRVYRLWCRNNPGFAERGRVHLIGHSLGSAMCVEVLSRQPTTTTALDIDSGASQGISAAPSLPQPEILPHFEFDTTNLFLLGSPSAFFLLLERGSLQPRHGRLKPGAEPGDVIAKDVVGERGNFGCVAVDNIYNILAKEDPIAYLLNGTVDPLWAASLRPAYVPSATTSFFKALGDAMRSVAGASPLPGTPAPALKKPPTLRLPSQLELEVHDFTREEIAERRAFLLNDNGQIDYFLRSGGGPLEIQYLNMLSAHTSYWTNPDLLRLLCTEIGRRPGKAHALPGMGPVKINKRHGMPAVR